MILDLQDKKNIRKKMQYIRDSISHDVRAQKDKIIKETVLNLIKDLPVKNILTYVSFRSEVDTKNMIVDLLRLGLNVIVPRVIQQTGMIKSYLIRDIGELSNGFCGILEPLDDKIFTCKRYVKQSSIQLCITPGVAFDEHKNRLGYGKGYYDRFFKPIKAQKGDDFLIVGLSYEEQILNSVPHTEEDIKMDIIVTDKRVIR